MNISIEILTESDSFSDRFLLIVQEDKVATFILTPILQFMSANAKSISGLLFMASFAYDRRGSLFLVRSKKIDASYILLYFC